MPLAQSIAPLGFTGGTFLILERTNMAQNTYTTNEITIHTDGACIGNPGPGGYAAILRRNNEDGDVIETRPIAGGEPNTTNNRMEMMAAIEGLRHINVDEAARITIVSDSQLLIKGMTEWLPGWQKRNWRKASGGEVINKDLWLNLIDLCKDRDVHWQWVRGHSGNLMNEEADRLANSAAAEQACPRLLRV